MLTTILDTIIRVCVIAIIVTMILYIVHYVRIRRWNNSNHDEHTIPSKSSWWSQHSDLIAHPDIRTIKDALDTYIIGNHHLKRGLILCLLSKWHLMIQWYPGTGKTKLTTIWHQLLWCKSTRIQGTSDLVPADLIGSQVYDRQTGTYVIHRWPLQHQIVIIDELNRMTPKAQSALLQVMQEQELTIDQQTLKLDFPPMIIATVNHNDLIGTYGIPDSVKDRFMLIAHSQILDVSDQVAMLHTNTYAISPLTNSSQIQSWQKEVWHIQVSPEICNYIVTKSQQWHALSHRHSQYLYTMSQAYARIQGRDHVTVEDIEHIHQLMYQPFV